MKKLEVTELLETDFSSHHLIQKAHELFEALTGDKLGRFTFPYKVEFTSDDDMNGIVRVVARDSFSSHQCLPEHQWDFPKSLLLK